jgi:Putative Actinobacterial Holin-X, holin superfamily III
MAQDGARDGSPSTLATGAGGSAPPVEERTLGQLVAQASQDVSGLVRAELALAKAELKVDVANGAVGAGLFAVAAGLVGLAVVLLSVAAAYGLVAVGLPPWAGFTVVAGLYLLFALILALVGRARLRRVGPPERAIREAQRTLAAVRPGGATGSPQ